MRALKSLMRDIRDDMTDAKAAVAVLFFAADLPRNRHDQAGHADRALRKLQDLIEELDRIIRHDDGSQLRLGAV